MKKRIKTGSVKKAVGVSMAIALAVSSMPGNVVFDWRPAVIKAADTTKTIDSSAVVQQIDSKETNRPGIPDGILLNELKRLVNTKLGRSVTNDITFAELMAYDGEIDLSSIGSQITSIKGLGYARKANKIVLTNVPVKAIDDYEFDGCTGLTEIVLPNGLETIGKFAFRNCNKLTKIVLPETTTSIGESAFDACTQLAELKIPAAVSNISKGAFGGCKALKEMTIPNGNVVLGASVFEGCESLETVHLPEGITEIPASFFAQSGITSIIVPTTVKEIKQSAFNSTYGLENIDLSKCINLKTLGSNAFAGSGIKTIQMPPNLYTIKSNAFNASDLTEISIPDSVQGAGDGVAEGGIEQNAFWDCRFLKKVSLPSGISVLQKETFRGCWNLTEVEIRNAENSILESIGDAAFSECNHLENTDFLKNLKNLKNIGDRAFHYEKITGKEDNIKYALYTGEKCLLDEKDVYGKEVYTAGLRSVVLPDSVTTLGKEVFTGQPNLKTVALGNGLSVIPESSFKGCALLETVTLPEYLKKIEADAFNGCVRLQGITFPNTLETIGDYAFSNCGVVEKADSVYYHVRYVDNKQVYTSRPDNNTTALECLIYNCDDNYNQKISTIFFEKDAMLTEEEYVQKGSPKGYTRYVVIAEKRYAKAETVYANDESKTKYSNYVFDEQTGKIVESKYVYSDYLSSDNAVIAPQEGYTGYFVRRALSNKLSVRDQYGLTDLTLPNSVKSIGIGAFYNCYNLQNITLSKQLTEIPESAFAVEKKNDLNKYDWTAQEQEPLQANYITKRTVALPDNLENIGQKAFRYNGNMKLTTGVLPSALTQIGESAFEECHSLESIIIPSKTKTIGNKAFYGCSEYLDTEEKIGGFSIIKMRKDAGLQEIDLTQASSLEEVGTYAFSLTPITQCTLPQKVTTVSQGLFATCPYLSKVICSEDTEAIKADVFSNCDDLASITVPAKATISYNAFRGYTIGSFSFSITDPDPISVSIGEEEKLPINTFLADYLRDQVQIKEKSGTTGFVEIAGNTAEELNGWNIYKAKVKGISEGTTKLSVVGTNNYALYDNFVFSKSPEVTVTVNVTKKKCTDIKDTRDSAVISIEDTNSEIRLNPEVLPADCSEGKVWSSENENVVSLLPDTEEVDGQRVTASSTVLIPKGLGTSKVTLKVGSVKKNYQVNVVVPATNITLDKTEISVKEDSKETIKLSPVMTYDTTKYSQSDWMNCQDIVAYTSDDETIATVSPDGVVKPISAGITHITATSLGSGKTATCEVRVLPDETMVYFTDAEGKTLDTSKPIQVQAKDVITLNIATEPVDSLSELTSEFSDKNMFTWLKNTTRLVETEDKGKQEKVIAMDFSAEKIGTGTITVLPKSYKNKDAVAATVTVNVTADTKDAAFATIDGLEVGTKKSVFGYLVTSAGKAEKIEDVKNITGDKVTFTSSDSTIASVDTSTGEVTGMAEGHVTITMQVENAQDASKNIVKTMELDVIRPFATNIVVTEKNNKNTMKAGETLQLETAFIPANAKDSVTYTSLTPEIASVDQTGKITGLKPGPGRVKVVTQGKEVSYIFEFSVTSAGTTSAPTAPNTPNVPVTPTVTNTPAPSQTKKPSVSVAKVTGLKVVNVKGKKIKAVWKKVKGAKGYRITYALDKKFKKGKKIVNIPKNSVVKTITKLKKGKTYYVKVQAYKKNGTKKVYGKASAVKKVKIKK